MARKATGARSAATAVALATCLSLPACAADPDPPSSAPPAGSDGAEPSPSPTSSATAAPTPTVSPATGSRIATPLLTMRFPRGWELYDGMAPSQYDAREPGGQNTVLYSSVDLIAPVPLPELADLYAGRSDWDRRPRELEPVTVDGVRCFRLRGERLGVPREVVGTQRGETAVQIVFEIDGRPAGRQRTIDSVLATVAWEPQ